MLLEHRGKRPSVDPSAYVAPTAVLCGDVRVGPETRVLFGAVVTAEDGSVEVGARCVVMENALIRGRAAHPVRLGDDVLVGPHAHLNGTEVGDGELVPIGWVAVGNPARAIAPWDHDEIWRIQEPLNFPRTVYGLPRSAPARERMERQTAWFAAHRDDRDVTHDGSGVTPPKGWGPRAQWSPRPQ